jgi:hypothetical protein
LSRSAVPVGETPSPAGRRSSLTGSGGGDIYRPYAVAERDGVKLNITPIARGFDADCSEMFDPVHMRHLYGLGYENGLSGEGWRPSPPDFAPAENRDAQSAVFGGHLQRGAE